MCGNSLQMSMNSTSPKNIAIDAYTQHYTNYAPPANFLTQLTKTFQNSLKHVVSYRGTEKYVGFICTDPMHSICCQLTVQILTLLSDVNMFVKHVISDNKKNT